MGLHGMVMCARRAHYELGCICAVDDFVIFPSEEGILVRKVCFFASINHMNLACAQIWDAKGGNEFEKTDRDILLDLEGIEDCLTYKELSPIRILAVPSSLWG